MLIKIIDPVESVVSARDAGIIRPILSFPAVFYRDGLYKKERVEYQKSTMTKSKDGSIYYFYTGFLDRIKSVLASRGIPCFIEGTIPKLPVYPQPITLRGDQVRLVQSILDGQRGTIQAATGTGKTVLAASIIHSFRKPTIFIVHTLTLVRQTAEEFKRFGLKNITSYTGEEKDLSGDIVVGTIQSFHKVPHLLSKFDVAVVDECHHISTFTGTYARVLRRLPCTVRIGLTATLPTTEEAKMTIEGLLGPNLDTFTLEEGISQGVLAKPIIKLIKIPINYRVKELTRYQDVYDAGVVNNRLRNETVINTVKPYIDEGKTVLILLTRIEHGENLKRIAQEKGLQPYFVQGSTESEQREDIKSAFKNKDIKLVIATVVFKEGVNIPSLNVICNAAGGKSEIATLQSIGRGLRTTQDKKEVILIDFFDPSHYYLVDHFGTRLCLYFEEGWL